MSANRLKTAASMLLALFFLTTTQTVQLQAAEPPSRLDGLWADLASQDEALATRAALGLAATPQETVPFLKQRLQAVKPEPKRIAQLLAQIDSDDFARREQAADELDYFGKFIKADLEKAIAGNSSAEVKKRAQAMLDKINGEAAEPAAAPPALTGRSISVANAGGKITILIDGKPLNMVPALPAPPRMAWVRATRATAVLEYIGTPEARKVLDGLADGENEAPPTKSARDAIERLKKKPG